MGGLGDGLTSEYAPAAGARWPRCPSAGGDWARWPKPGRIYAWVRYVVKVNAEGFLGVAPEMACAYCLHLFL